MPRWTTPIPIDGPHGNIFAVIGNVRSLARQLGTPHEEIEQFSVRIMATKSYAEALDVVREWFPIEGD